MSTDKTVRYVYRTRNYATEIWILNRKTCAMLKSAIAVEFWHQRTTASDTYRWRDTNSNSKIVWKGEKKTEEKTRVRISWRTIGTLRSRASGGVKFSGSVAMLRWNTLLPVSQYKVLERETFLFIGSILWRNRWQTEESNIWQIRSRSLPSSGWGSVHFGKRTRKFRRNLLLLEAADSSETVAPVWPDSYRLSLPVGSFI